MNRNRTKFPILLAWVLLVSLAWVPPADAFLGELFNRKDRRVLSAEELSTQERAASGALERARQNEAAGRSRQARDGYRSIVRSYPRTESAAEAQYHYARLLDAEGSERKAFEEYQKLITNYRNTPYFEQSIARQYAIAESLRNSDRKGFLGIGAAVQPSKLVEKFEQIGESAPHTEFAPKSLLRVGHVKAGQGEIGEAIVSYQKVVDTYAGTDSAAEAQYEIFRLRGVRAERSNSPVEDRAQVEAGLDFVNQNPEDERSGEIKSNLQEIEERSMQKLYETGRFYERSNKPDSARVYYREVVSNPNTPWAAKARERLEGLDRAGEVEGRAGFFGINPLRRGKVEMRTTEDEVVPIPLEEGAGESP